MMKIRIWLEQIMGKKQEKNTEAPKKIPIKPEPKPEKCPRCGSKDIVIIHYGYPTPAAMEYIRKNKMAMGGCVIRPDAPKWKCNACGHRWGRRSWARPKQDKQEKP